MKKGFLENCFVVLKKEGKTVFISQRGVKRAVNQAVNWVDENRHFNETFLAKIEI